MEVVGNDIGSLSRFPYLANVPIPTSVTVAANDSQLPYVLENYPRGYVLLYLGRCSILLLYIQLTMASD